LLRRLETAPHLPRDRQCPRQHRATAPIHHRDQRDKSPLEPNIGDIRTPDVIHPRDRSPTQQIRVHPRQGRHLTRVRFGRDRFHPDSPQQPRYALAIHRVPLMP
jgi:hypothetical protein